MTPYFNLIKAYSLRPNTKIYTAALQFYISRPPSTLYDPH